VQEVLEGLRLGTVAEFFANEVLDCFDVVVRRGLNCFHSLGVIKREVIDDVVQNIFHDRRWRTQFADFRLVGQALQPADFYKHTETNQAEFAENIAEAVDLVRVTAVCRG
jgi:hypothetical protein